VIPAAGETDSGRPDGRGPLTGPPILGVRRLLLVGTGALSVSMMPFWLNWLRETNPDVELRVVLTPSALRFVSADTVSAISRASVVIDSWPASDPLRPTHIDLAGWSELIVVYPATAHFVARFALGIVDTPVLLALQSFRGTVGVAPALPPRADDSIAIRRHMDTLREDPRVVVAPTTTQRSHTTGEAGSGAVAPLPVLLSMIQRHRAAIAQPAAAEGAGVS
jgi:phosphopantothenoylcysteine synthetase/decarboxylase